MKKLLSVVVLLALAVALALPALADQPYNGPLPLYVNREKIKVYREQSKDIYRSADDEEEDVFRHYTGRQRVCGKYAEQKRDKRADNDPLRG